MSITLHYGDETEEVIIDPVGSRGGHGGYESEGAMAYTIVGAEFPPISFNASDCTFQLSDTSVGTIEATTFDGKDVLKITPSTVGKEIVLYCSGLTNKNIDLSVYKYISVEYYLAGSRPKNAPLSVDFNTDNPITTYTRVHTSTEQHGGWVVPNQWITAQGDLVDVCNRMDTSVQKHLVSKIFIHPCNGALANQYVNTTIYISKITFMENNGDGESKPFAFYLDGYAGLSVGDECSVHVLRYPKLNETTPGFSVQTEKAATIKAIHTLPGDDSICYVELSRRPINVYTFAMEGDGTPENYLTEEGWDSEVNTFRIINKPTVGNRRIGYGALNFTNTGEAHSKGAVNFSEGGKAVGSYAFTSGKGCEAEYCADAGGLNTKAEGHQSMTRGYGTQAKRSNSVATGEWNVGHINALYEVGNGKNNVERKNAMTVWEDGRMSIESEPTEDNDVVTLGFLEKKLEEAMAKLQNGEYKSSSNE